MDGDRTAREHECEWCESISSMNVSGINMNSVGMTGVKVSCVNLSDAHDATTRRDGIKQDRARHDADTTPPVQIAIADSQT